MCTDCKGEHIATDKTCSYYEQEACLLRFKSENHLSFSEARRQFHVSGKTRSSMSYATVASTAPSPPPLTSDYVTKADLQDSLQVFAENIASMLQTVLDAQAAACQNMITAVTGAVIGAMKQIFTVEEPPTPSVPPCNNTITSRSLPPSVMERIEKFKKQKKSDSPTLGGSGSASAMDTSSPDDKVLEDPPQLSLPAKVQSHVT